jgi:hypothetical protein
MGLTNGGGRSMRKAKRNSEKNQFVNLEASLKKLQSMLFDPAIRNWYAGGGAKGIRERLLKIDFNVLRNVVDRVPIVSAIINTRIDQVLPFAKYITEDQAREGEKGFQVVPASKREGKDYDPDKADALGEFMSQTGFVYDPKREDDISDFLQMAVRELLVIDQIATEIQLNRLGETIAFWLLDGATIRRTNDDYPVKDVAYIQEIDEKVVAEYTANTIIFDYKNKRADIRFRGYGYSMVEMCIDVVTTILFGYNHLRDQFIKDKIPKGFISVMGDIDQNGITAIQQYWYSAMNGAGGQWAIPILPSGKDGVGIEFKPIGQSNKDMEYHRLMMYLSSIIAAVFGIDLAELGIKADDSTSIFGGNSEPNIKNSRDRGLTSLLSFLEQYTNKILRKVDTDYRIKITNIEAEDENRKATIRKTRLETDTTIDELREKDGKKPFGKDWSMMPLNPYSVQMAQAAAQAEQGQAGPGEGQEQAEAGQGQAQDEEEGNDEAEGKEDGSDVDLSDLLGSGVIDKGGEEAMKSESAWLSKFQARTLEKTRH